jgi:hypothetical protein
MGVFAMSTIGPNPTLIRLDIPRARARRAGESVVDYLRYAARVARRTLSRLLQTDEYRYCHRSFAIRDAMLVAEKACQLGTFGVEYINKGSNRRSPAIDYLNTGDTYAVTLLYVNGRFRVGCWGDIVERGNYA